MKDIKVGDILQDKRKKQIFIVKRKYRAKLLYFKYIDGSWKEFENRLRGIFLFPSGITSVVGYIGEGEYEEEGWHKINSRLAIKSIF